MDRVLLNDCRLITNPTARDVRWSTDCLMETFRDPEKWRLKYEDVMSSCDTLLLKHRGKIIATICLIEPEKTDITERKNDLLSSAKDCQECRQLKWFLGHTALRPRNTRFIVNFTVHPNFQGKGLWTFLLRNAIREKCRGQLALFSDAYIPTGSSHVFEKLWFHGWGKKKCELSETEESRMIKVLQ